MPFAVIPFLLLAIPIVEIAVFIMVGDLIGLWPTLGLVLLTAVIGSLLLKQQGIGTLRRIQAETSAGRLPGKELIDGVMIAMAGVLLLTPGLVTDTIGFLLFVPGVRGQIRKFLRERVVMTATSGGVGGFTAARTRGRPAGAPGRPDVIDLSGEEFQRRPDPDSPWNDGSPGESGDKPGSRTLH